MRAKSTSKRCCSTGGDSFLARRHRGNRLAAERDHLRASVNPDYLIELRQVEVNEAGAVGEAIVTMMSKAADVAHQLSCCLRSGDRPSRGCLSRM